MGVVLKKKEKKKKNTSTFELNFINLRKKNIDGILR
jgi:hypothetical protein